MLTGASAFLKTSDKAPAIYQPGSMNNEEGKAKWEQIQENALARAGHELPKTVIHIGEVKPGASAFLQAGDASAADVAMKAGECMACVQEHFDDSAEWSVLVQGEEKSAEQICSFCALYAFGGIYASKGAQVNSKAWDHLPKDKISLIEDGTLLASPARMPFWKDAAKKIITDKEFCLKEAVRQIKQEDYEKFNIMKPDADETDELTSMIMKEQVDDSEKMFVSAGSLIQEQGAQQVIKTQSSLLKASMEQAITMLKSATTDAAFQGDALYEASKMVVQPASLMQQNLEIGKAMAASSHGKTATDGTFKDQTDLLQKLDDAALDGVESLKDADNLGQLSDADAKQNIETAADGIYQRFFKGEIAEKSVFLQLAHGLSKFLPKATTDSEAKENLLKKKDEPVKVKTQEQMQQEGLQSLQGVLDAPQNKKPSALVQTEDAKYSEAMKKWLDVMDELHLPGYSSLMETQTEAEKAAEQMEVEKQQALKAIEEDFSALVGYDPQGDMASPEQWD